MGVNWNNRFMKLAEYVSRWSKDKSTGVGSVIVDNENRILSIGYNGFPTGCVDSINERYERPLKYKYTEHAERNAIYNAARNGIKLKGSKIYLPWFTCVDCTRAIIQSGISEVICKTPDLNNERWGDDFKISLELFKEANIKITYMDDIEEKYEVHLFMDDIYEVFKIINKNYVTISQESVYQGRLSDCESYIRLKQNGYL